jgi:hypothetical protein
VLIETVVFVTGAAVVAAVGVWTRARFGPLRGTLLTVALAALVIAALVDASDEGPATWAILFTIPVVFVAQTACRGLPGSPAPRRSCE